MSSSFDTSGLSNTFVVNNYKDFYMFKCLSRKHYRGEIVDVGNKEFGFGKNFCKSIISEYRSNKVFSNGEILNYLSDKYGVPKAWIRTILSGEKK